MQAALLENKMGTSDMETSSFEGLVNQFGSRCCEQKKSGTTTKLHQKCIKAISQQSFQSSLLASLCKTSYCNNESSCKYFHAKECFSKLLFCNYWKNWHDFGMTCHVSIIMLEA